MDYEAELIAEGKCPEVVMVQTEDGPETGRCMRPISDKVWMYKGYSDPVARPTQLPACEGHAEAMVGYGAMTEAERIDWEKRHALAEEGRGSAYYEQWS